MEFIKLLKVHIWRPIYSIRCKILHWYDSIYVIPMFKSYSQYYQDIAILFLLKFKREGYFIDIGANDGFTFSNSYLFEKKYAWNGLCIEPLPNVFNKLNKLRTCTCLNIAISAENGVIDFLELHGSDEMLSGIKRFMSYEHLKRIEEAVTLNKNSQEIIQVLSQPLREVIPKQTLDFISIDTEGSELIALQTIDFNKTSIKVFSIENSSGDKEVGTYLKKFGYKKILCVAGDDLFIYKPVFLDKIMAFLFQITKRLKFIKRIK